MKKNYSIHYKNRDEFNSTIKYIIKDELKDKDLNEVSQVFLKTYDNKGEEQECILYFCEFQNINILKENNLK